MIWKLHTPVAIVAAALISAPASADMRSLLLGRPATKTVSEGVFEVTARGNNLRERQSSFEMALVKAAERAARTNSPYIAVLREKTGTWTMRGRRIGDETTLRVRLLGSEVSVTDEAGAPARTYPVAEVLSGTR